MITVSAPKEIPPNSGNKFNYTGEIIFLKKCINTKWRGIYSRDGLLRQDLGRHVEAGNLSFSRYNGTRMVGDTLLINMPYFYKDSFGQDDVVLYGPNSILVDNSKLNSKYDTFNSFNFEFRKDFEFKIEIDKYYNINEDETSIGLVFSDKLVKHSSDLSAYIITVNSGIVNLSVWDDGHPTFLYGSIHGNLFDIGVRRNKKFNCEIFYTDELGEHILFSTKSETGFVFCQYNSFQQGSGDFGLMFKYSGEATLVSPFYMSGTWAGYLILEGTSVSRTSDFCYDEVFLMLTNDSHGYKYVNIYNSSGETIFSTVLFEPYGNTSLVDADFNNGIMAIVTETSDRVVNYICDFSNGYVFIIDSDKTTYDKNIFRGMFGYATYFSQADYEKHKNKICNSIIPNDISDNAIWEFDNNSGISVVGDAGVWISDSEKFLSLTSIYGSSVLIKNIITDNNSRTKAMYRGGGIVFILPDSIRFSLSMASLKKITLAQAFGYADPATLEFTPDPSSRIDFDEFTANRSLVLVISYNGNKYYYKCKLINADKINNKLVLEKLSTDTDPLPPMCDSAWVIAADNNNLIWEYPDIDWNRIAEGTGDLNKEGITICNNFYISNIDFTNNPIIYNFNYGKIDNDFFNIANLSSENIVISNIDGLLNLGFNDSDSRISIPYVFNASRLKVFFVITLDSVPSIGNKNNILSLHSSISKNSFRLYVATREVSGASITGLFIGSGDVDNDVTIKDNIIPGESIGITISNGRINNIQLNLCDDIGNITVNNLNYLIFGNDYNYDSSGMEIFLPSIYVDIECHPLPSEIKYKNSYTINNNMLCKLNNNSFAALCSNGVNSKIFILDAMGRILASSSEFDVGDYSSFSYAGDKDGVSLLYVNGLGKRLYQAEVSSEFDDLFEFNPKLTDPYETYIASSDIIDGSGLSLSELKNNLFSICSNSDDIRVATRCMLIYAFKEFGQILSPYIDKDTILSTRTKKIRSPNTEEITNIYTRFITSKYKFISPVIQSQLNTKKTPKTSLSLMCAFVVWRYIYEFNRSIK